MIRKLTGLVLDSGLLSVVIDVNGVGYMIRVTGREHAQYTPGSKISLCTYLAVRENALDLYGFPTEEELEMFERLIELPKVGPKSALQILSQADVTLLKKSVLMDDPTYLVKMSGMGKKTAEKIVSGLKDVFADSELEEQISTNTDGDVVDALITLGYTQKEARDVTQNLPPEIANTNERIKEALKQLAK